MVRRRLTLLAAAIAVAAVALAVPRGAPPSRARVDPPPLEEAPRDTEASPAAADLAIEVVAREGAPVEGASVRAEVDGATVSDVVTDAHGRAAMRRIQGSLYRARKPGYLVAWRRGSDDPVLRFVLDPGVPVEGRVLFEDGTPVHGCEVHAWDPEGRRVEGERFPLEDTLFTDADGRFQIAGSEPGRPLGVRASLPGYAEVVVLRGPADAPEPIMITLGGGATIEGFVLDDEGRPRGGAVVGVVAYGRGSPFQPRYLTSPAIAETTSDPSGRYRLLGLEAPAAYMVYGRDGDRIGRAGPVLAESGRSSRADVTVQMLGEIRVKVVSGDGGAVRHPRVEVVRRDIDDDEKLDDASLVMRLLPIPHEVRVSADGFLTASVVVHVEPGRVVEKEVVLRRGRKVWVRTENEAGGAVASHVTLEWIDTSPGLGRSVAKSWDHTDGWCPVRWTGVGQGTLRVQASGFLDAEQEIGALDEEVTVVLRRAPEVISRLPVAASHPIELGSGRYANADPEGRFTLSVRADVRRICVRADQEDYASGPIRVRPEGVTDAGMLEPARPVVLSGRVLDPAGRPVAGARLQLLYCGATRTDRSGSFRFDHAPPAPTRLLIAADGHPRLWEMIEPRENVTVRIPIPGEVRGRVVDADGESVPGWFPFYRMREDGSFDRELSWYAEADSLGAFRALLPPGRFRCFPRAPGLHRDTEPGTVVEIGSGDRKEIDLRLPWSLRLWR